MRDGFLVKIMPPAGAAVYRLHVRAQHLATVAAVLGLVLGAIWTLHLHRLHAAAAEISGLQAQHTDQQRKLDALERQTQSLQKQNVESQRTLESIRRALGAQRASAGGSVLRNRASLVHEPASVTSLALRVQRLQRAEAQTRAQAGRLSRLAFRVLNLRHLASIARNRMIAAIPSLNPVNGGINAAFGYRTNPFPEFHKGLDLAAAYGTPVHAAAAGVVAFAGWDGGFGIKVDIDHANGYHTWYCHLSRLAVVAGQHVRKGDAIAAVGSTGESTGAHLHYQVMHAGVAIDPLPYLNGVPPNILATLPADSRVQ